MKRRGREGYGGWGDRREGGREGRVGTERGREGEGEGERERERDSSIGRTATPCNISLIVLVACLFAGAVLFARALLRRGLFVGIFRVVFRCGFYTWDSKGAKECKSCRSRKMQKNASLLAIVAVDTAENEPSEVGDAAGYAGSKSKT